VRPICTGAKGLICTGARLRGEDRDDKVPRNRNRLEAQHRPACGPPRGVLALPLPRPDLPRGRRASTLLKRRVLRQLCSNDAFLRRRSEHKGHAAPGKQAQRSLLCPCQLDKDTT
jgi:hypothetical protein